MTKCFVCGIENNVYKRNGINYCAKHRQQLINYGKIISITGRTPNRFVIKQDHIEIYLRNIKRLEIAKTIIDKKDFDKVKNIKWHLDTTKSNGRNYVHGYVNNKKVKLHRYLLDSKINQQVDHKNRDTLDNRRINLREVSSSINSFNTNVSRRNKSGVVGVWKTKSNKWLSYIRKDKKLINLGTFKNFEDAVTTRKQAELKYFGEIIKR